ncbi:hypothetical protein [Candidatus Bathycorpusculum sp.]|uniref:hypothetical protein n=1 Tax=Candidatus Bathycorpusculum sp. TaxID=2994959 RepID=UPI0028196029|nr:hypothetical protein [Candidatus Termitimicrobium sp.]MCL2431279.1 hypothetical protein [Candidatus Termitimicrobium sp.]
MSKVIGVTALVVIINIALFASAISTGLIPITHNTTLTVEDTANTTNSNKPSELPWTILAAIFIPLISSLGIIAIYIKK